MWQIPLHYLARNLACQLVRELVCDRLLWQNSITLFRSHTWSQTWFLTCRREVQVIFYYAILLASRSATSSGAGRKLDNVIEFGRELVCDLL